MSTSFVLGIGKETIMTCLWVVGPTMVIGFVVGIFISILQTVMQIQEMTLSFVPKLIAICAGLLIFGDWMLQKLITYTQLIMGDFPRLLGLQ